MEKIAAIDLIKGLNYYFDSELKSYGTFVAIETDDAGEFVKFIPIVNTKYGVFMNHIEFQTGGVKFIMCETEKQNSHATH